MRRIVLHIDTLVLRGIARADATAVSAGVQAELRRRLAEPGAARSLTEGGHRDRIRVGTVHVAAATGGRAMGRAIAGSLVTRVSS